MLALKIIAVVVVLLLAFFGGLVLMAMGVQKVATSKAAPILKETVQVGETVVSKLERKE